MGRVFFTTSRGLRQGHPLSPLFNLVVDIFDEMLVKGGK